MAEGKGAKGLSVGIIMDGNGRWAKSRGLPRVAGHKRGADVFDDISFYAAEQELAAITYYAFSTENWTRPQAEIDAIMDLFTKCLRKLQQLSQDGYRFTFLGDRSRLSERHHRQMNELEEETRDNNGTILSIAVNYGSRQEITRAARELALEVQAGRLRPDEIDEARLAGHLYTNNQPDPDFILRTSGEQRLSNFLLWQGAYSEFVFVDKHWPDFTRADFDAAVAEYHRRDRRYGGI